MSQVASEAPVSQPEADPAGAGATNPTTEDSFPRHETYFFRDGNITFLVDGTLYCVHRYFFARDSVYFSSKFTQLGVRDHESLRTVVSLGEVERRDFEAFLSVVYPENFDEHSLSYEQWRSVLHLSSRWGFTSLRKLALRSVKPPTACDQLLLARTYGVDHWVLPALSSLCERAGPISLKEARQMSIEDVVLVATVREDICNHSSRAEIPVLIEATQARIAHAAGDGTSPASSKSMPSEKEEPGSTEVVTASPAVTDSGSKTAATTSSKEDDKREDNEHAVEVAVSSEGETNKDQQELEQQIQKVKSEDNPGDRVEEVASKVGDETSEKESKAVESSGETRNDVEAGKVKSETPSGPGEVAHIAAALTEEPEAQDQTETRGSTDDAAARPANPQSAPVAEPQPQAAARATPLYWRRLGRYMTTSPIVS